MKGAEQFSSDIDNREFAQLITELAAPHLSGAGITDDEHQFQFSLKGMRGESIRLEPLPPLSRALRDQEKIQLVCGLPSGLIWLKGQLHQDGVNEFSLSLNRAETEVRRLQRRSSIRAAVPRGCNITFKITSLAQSVRAAGSLLPVRDLSVGGFRLEWPLGELSPEVEQHISGVLSFPNGKPIELFGTIRSRELATATHWHVGVEFQPLSLKDEQALLFACLRNLG